MLLVVTINTSTGLCKINGLRVVSSRPPHRSSEPTFPIETFIRRYEIREYSTDFPTRQNTPSLVENPVFHGRKIFISSEQNWQLLTKLTCKLITYCTAHVQFDLQMHMICKEKKEEISKNLKYSFTTENPV